MNSTYAKENLSTKQPQKGEEARLQGADGDQERQGRFEAPPGEGAQALNSVPLLKAFGLPKACRLLKTADFRRVYAAGRRFEGRFMTAFLVPADLPEHRIGITASKKAVGKAHERNRAKRLLREAFRLSRVELSGLQGRYEWVLNGRRNLLRVKLEEPLKDFRRIVELVKKSEAAKIALERSAE
jgi:ribonuclease P protein component